MEYDEDTIINAAEELGVPIEEFRARLESVELKTLNYFNIVENMKEGIRKDFGCEPTKLHLAPNLVESFVIAKAMWDAETLIREDDNDEDPTFCGLEIVIDPLLEYNGIGIK